MADQRLDAGCVRSSDAFVCRRQLNIVSQQRPEGYRNPSPTRADEPIPILRLPLWILFLRYVVTEVATMAIFANCWHVTGWMETPLSSDSNSQRRCQTRPNISCADLSRHRLSSSVIVGTVIAAAGTFLSKLCPLGYFLTNLCICFLFIW